MEVRMSLADAAALLNTAPNTIRSRFKAGKIRGERDNSGKIWVWIDPEAGSKPRTSKPSKSSSDTHLEALTERLNRSLDELDQLRHKAGLADLLAAEKALLLDQIEDLKSDREIWRKMALQRGFWGLFRR